MELQEAHPQTVMGNFEVAQLAQDEACGCEKAGEKRSRTDCCMRRYVTCKRCQKSQNVANTSQNCCVGAKLR